MVAAGSQPVFGDRDEAGRLLAELLVERGERGRADLVLGIPRGGVVVAAAVAQALHCPLDVALARKVGAPHNPELAIGAVGPDGRAVIDRDLVARLGAREDWVTGAVTRAAEEVQARLARFRGDRPPPAVEGRRVLVVDDGIATGATALTVGHWLEAAGAGAGVLAVPVAPPGAPDRLSPPYETVVALAFPPRFTAVGLHYERFDQTTDEEVLALLSR